MAKTILTERHPWPPFVPDDARIFIMGTFPPPQRRWSMDFFYPNRTNDFWPMMGLLFCGNRDTLVDRDNRTYRLDSIKTLLTDRKIALGDTGLEVRRLQGNASDKHLEIVTPFPLLDFLAGHPSVKTIAATGEKAASVVAGITHTQIPPAACPTITLDGLTIWRMPSTSRAYPLPLEMKAEAYEKMFATCGILTCKQ